MQSYVRRARRPVSWSRSPARGANANMQSSFSRRALRSTASAMLFVWLIALGIGVANACLVNDGHARHGHGGHQNGGLLSAPVGGNPTPLADRSSDDLSLMAGDVDLSPATTTCLNFCAAGQSSAVQQPGEIPGSVSMPSLSTGWWAPPPPPYRLSSWLVRGDPSGSHQPVSIRVLRLTI